MFSSITTGEQIAQPEYKGTGYVVLEPSFKHFLLLNLDNEDIIVDKGMFYCAQKSVKVSLTKPLLFLYIHLQALLRSQPNRLMSLLTALQ